MDIPPAWREVWISPDSNGHLHAVGSDEAGRRQYIYHAVWTAGRERQKFDRVIVIVIAIAIAFAFAFASRLPPARSVVAGHLVLPGMPRERALAAAFRLLDLGHFRIGSDVYAETNGSFWSIHASPRSCSSTGKVADHRIHGQIRVGPHRRNDDLLDAVGAMISRRSGGDELLAYRQGRSWRHIASPEINE